MAKADIMFDKTEIVLRIAEKRPVSYNIRAEQTTTVTFRPTTVKKLFKSEASEVMLIKFRGGPAEGTAVTKEALETMKKGSWATAKMQMAEFCKYNKLTLHYEDTEWKPVSLAKSKAG